VPSLPVRFRARAASDVEAAVDHYRHEAGEAVALEFIDSLERCVRQLGRSHQSGSLRFSYELDIPELRVLAMRRFPYMIFYVPNDDSIDVWRVLHVRREALA
jgi:toxin ParE1/3/4